MEELIYDRTSSDVEYALNNPDSTLFLKGAYNYTDLNRVESWCDYLANLLNSNGYSISISTKTDWNMEDFPTDEELERIRLNIKALKDGFFSLTRIYSYSNKMSYKRANNYEKILDEIYNMLISSQNYFVYSGVSNSGQGRMWQNRFRKKYNHVLNILADGKFKNISGNYLTNSFAKITSQGDYTLFKMTNTGSTGYIYNIYTRASFDLQSGHQYIYVTRWRNTAEYPSNGMGMRLKDSSSGIKQIGFTAHGNEWKTDYSIFTINNNFTGVQLGIYSADINEGSNFEIQYQAFIDITGLDSDYVEYIKQNIDKIIAFPKVAVSLMTLRGDTPWGGEMIE